MTSKAGSAQELKEGKREGGRPDLPLQWVHWDCKGQKAQEMELILLWGLLAGSHKERVDLLHNSPKKFLDASYFWHMHPRSWPTALPKTTTVEAEKALKNFKL